MTLKRCTSSVIEMEVTREENNLVQKLSEDLLDHVFRFLSPLTLCRSAQVCKLWKEVAQRVMSKRCIHHVLMRPYESHHSCFTDEYQVKGNVSLFFCASRPQLRNADNIEYAILYQYHHKFPDMGKKIMLGVDHSMLNNHEVKSCCEFNRQTHKTYQANGVLGINLGDTRDLKVKVAWCESCEERSVEYARDILQQLRPNEHEGNPVYLMFACDGYSVGKHVMSMLRERYKDSQPNVWGGTMPTFIKCDASYPKESEREYVINKRFTTLHGFLGILLQRPRLSAHSMVVRLDEDLTAKLVHFKNKVTLRSRSLGLICGAHTKGKVYVYKKLMRTVRREFQRVKFVGYFNGPQLQYYGCDNADTDGSRELIHEKSISIMILTYD